ncbi:hypothetical protein [Caenispirillum bisanense]|uniref:Uncharacterized protein n=1 Tax=Caenispirillum bisanense TaxID=414052 RepID=A0A286H1W7_9PROT|nr:hypothetical protein [Caenispirillum bisanense]SOE01757.1 hypothetical protein SAMN05421508_1234 [Caenispirillum bisanense]
MTGQHHQDELEHAMDLGIRAAEAIIAGTSEQRGPIACPFEPGSRAELVFWRSFRYRKELPLEGEAAGVR